MMERVKEMFDENEIDIPYPQMDIHVCGGTEKEGQ